ncbi:MAG: helix-turn-helix transcriptional regulator [Clostridia bacterium]|nr:helix-turn-helix transcriptional regulator [Clostridia bacterium]
MQFVLKPFKTEINIKKLANIHYFEFTSNYETEEDSHPFLELLYVDSESIIINSDSYSGELKEGQLIVHGAMEKHSLKCGATAPNVVIIGFESSSEKISELSKAPITLPLELKKMLAEIIKEARTVYLPPYDVPNIKDMKKRNDFSFGADQLIKNYLQIFLIKCLRLLENSIENSQSDKNFNLNFEGDIERVKEVKKYLDCNFAQKINVSELCFLFGTNKTTLSKEFKQVFNKTIMEYVNCLKIEHTKRLLRENVYTLTEIASILSISSVHYLTALFKKHVGITPSEYLNKVKNKLKI